VWGSPDIADELKPDVSFRMPPLPPDVNVETFKHRRKKEIKHGRISKTTVTQATGADSRPGDWVCPGCRLNCFASKDECCRCGEPKPSAKGVLHAQPSSGSFP
jgi:hypothetical protein